MGLVPFRSPICEPQATSGAGDFSRRGPNSVREDLPLAGITSPIPATLAGDEFMIPPDQLVACGLPKPSIIKLLKLVTPHRSLVIKRIGSRPASALARGLARIRELL